jgi:tetraacyldisaccharide 4'-kinase
MRDPHFWRDIDPRSRAAAPLTRLLLTPAAALYAAAGRRRLRRAAPLDCGLPVICVGNLTLGGAGKTPVSAYLRSRLASRGLRAATLSRGYGGSLPGPVRVDAARHTAREVGDEPLMLSASGESWIARHRPEGALAMKADGVEAIIMDDGHQNPTLWKTASIVVIDAAEPFGNGFVFPKGPLREPVTEGLARADAVVLMGDGPVPDIVAQSTSRVLRARLAPLAPPPPGAYVAFAGIGRPQRFFDALAATPGITLADATPFPDHHMFSASDLSYLRKLAAERGRARLIATAKDHVRLPPDFRREVAVAEVAAEFEAPAELDLLLDQWLGMPPP